MIDVTQLHCPESGLPEGEQGSYHSFVPRAAAYPRGAREHVCRKCGKTEKRIRDEAYVRGTA